MAKRAELIVEPGLVDHGEYSVAITDTEGNIFALCRTDAAAEGLTEAWNVRDDLIAALEDMLAYVDRNIEDDGDTDPEAVSTARAALAAAGNRGAP